MKRCFSFFIAVFLVVASLGQVLNPLPYDLEVRSEDRGDGSYDINADIYRKGTYTIIVRFEELSNLNVRGVEYIRTSVGSAAGYEYKKSLMVDGRVLTLTPISPEQPSYYRYSYSYARGRLAPDKVEHDFVYRLPYGAGKSVKALDLYNIESRHFGEEDPENWKAIEFSMSQGDTVYAARKGLVVEITDKYDPVTVESQRDVQFMDSSNEIMVEHADGTLATYKVLQKGSMMVKPGDTVYPDTPLALAGSYDGAKYQLRFQIYYLTLDEKARPTQNISDRFEYAWVNPVFETAEGKTCTEHGETYTAVINNDLITGEMTRREANQRAKGR